MVTVELIPCLQDNYTFIIYAPEAAEVFVVDPAEAQPVLAWLQSRNKTLKAILNTHHHHDHVGGNLELQRQTGCQIIGFAEDHYRLPGLSWPIRQGNCLNILGETADVIELPGHTLGHIGYYIPAQNLIFVGDTLFSIGCGRLFEGTPAQMWRSLQKILCLPDETQLYCAHEYTLANIQFTQWLEGLNSRAASNEALQSYKVACQAKRTHHLPTVPTTLGREKALNPFLAVNQPEYRAKIGLGYLTAEQAFTEIRKQKDVF